MYCLQTNALTYFSNIRHPFPNIHEGLFTSDVIDENDTLGKTGRGRGRRYTDITGASFRYRYLSSAVESLPYCPVAFLPRRVPEQHLVVLGANRQHPGLEIHTCTGGGTYVPRRKRIEQAPGDVSLTACVCSPIVLRKCSRKSSCAHLSTKHVLPTAESPTSMIFNVSTIYEPLDFARSIAEFAASVDAHVDSVMIRYGRLRTP